MFTEIDFVSTSGNLLVGIRGSRPVRDDRNIDSKVRSYRLTRSLCLNLADTVDSLTLNVVNL